MKYQPLGALDSRPGRPSHPFSSMSASTIASVARVVEDARQRDDARGSRSVRGVLEAVVERRRSRRSGSLHARVVLRLRVLRAPPAPDDDDVLVRAAEPGPELRDRRLRTRSRGRRTAAPRSRTPRGRPRSPARRPREDRRRERCSGPQGRRRGSRSRERSGPARPAVRPSSRSSCGRTAAAAAATASAAPQRASLRAITALPSPAAPARRAASPRLAARPASIARGSTCAFPRPGRASVPSTRNLPRRPACDHPRRPLAREEHDDLLAVANVGAASTDEREVPSDATRHDEPQDAARAPPSTRRAPRARPRSRCGAVAGRAGLPGDDAPADDRVGGAGHLLDARRDEASRPSAGAAARRSRAASGRGACAAIVAMVGSARHGQAPRTLRPVPHRIPAHRRRPDGALQLAVGAAAPAAPSSSASRTPTRSARRRRPRRRSSTGCAGSGSTGTRGPTSAARTARTSRWSASTSTRRTPRSSSPRGRPTPATARGRSSTPARKQAEAREAPVPLPRHLPREAVRPRRSRTSSASACPSTARRRCDDLVKGHITTPHDTLQDEVILRARRRAALQLRRGRRRHHDGDHPRRARRRPREQHRRGRSSCTEALGYPVPPFAHLPMILGAGQDAALEAPRRDERHRVPRHGLPARGGGELPRAARLVARRPGDLLARGARPRCST